MRFAALVIAAVAGMMLGSFGARAAQETCAALGDVWCSESGVPDSLLRLAPTSSDLIVQDGCLPVADTICGE